MRDNGHAGGGQSDGDQDQRADVHPVGSEITKRDVIGCVQQHWRDEQHEDELGRQVDARGTRDERQYRPSHGEQRRVRDPDAARDGRQHRRAQQQN